VDGWVWKADEGVSSPWSRLTRSWNSCWFGRNEGRHKRRKCSKLFGKARHRRRWWLPTHLNLARHNALPSESPTACVLCGRGKESSSHLFFHCEVTSLIWQKVMCWLDFSFITPPKKLIYWDCWGREGMFMPRRFVRVFDLFDILRFGWYGTLEIIKFSIMWLVE